MLCENGFGFVWEYPQTVNKDSFHKFFRERLDTHHIQNWNTRLSESNRLKTLRLLHHEYKPQKYIRIIRNPEIREIYTRMRIDLNILSTSKAQGSNQQDVCPICNESCESVGHFLLDCEGFAAIRNVFHESFSSHQCF